MVAARRVLFFVEWALIAIFALALLATLADLLSAWHAEPCGPRATQGCYPWGAEGPAADYWNYASKRHYLTSSIFGAVVASATLLGAILVFPKRRILVLLAGVASLYLGNFLLPRLMT